MRTIKNKTIRILGRCYSIDLNYNVHYEKTKYKYEVFKHKPQTHQLIRIFECRCVKLCI